MGAGLNTPQPPMPPYYGGPTPRPVAPPFLPPPDRRLPAIPINERRPVAPPPPPLRPLPINQGGSPILAPLPPNFVDRGPYRPIQTPPPQRSPIDMVREPGFGSAMDQQFYMNLINDIISNIYAARGVPPAGFRADDYRGQDPLSRNTPYRPSQPGQPRPSGPDFIDSRDPNKSYLMDMVNYYDPATGEVTSRTRGVVPGPGSRFTKYSGQLPQGPNGEQLGYIPGYVPPGQGGQRPPQSPQFTQDRLMGAPVEQQPGYGIPQGPQTPQGAMAAYNNLLQQGIQRNNTINQDAASNFANMQAGAPTTQPAVPANLPNPTMSLGGTNTAKPKAPKPIQNFPNIRAF